ncbi:hypothetical protein E4U40_002065 [Claviceps sp. LM458 group G5]|nr:hypothetical protein E4U40_002065 [Claviceps sp. LM458 group G5]
MQAHEVIDEERRTRIAEMSYCGIRHLNHNSIPFGAPAIEQGQEVEGIWNSCRVVSDTNQATSPATLPNDGNNRPLREREGVVYSSIHDSHEDEVARPTSPSSSVGTHSSAPSSTYHDCRSTGHPDDDVDDMAIVPVRTEANKANARMRQKPARDVNVASRAPNTPLTTSPQPPHDAVAPTLPAHRDENSRTHRQPAMKDDFSSRVPNNKVMSSLQPPQDAVGATLPIHSDGNSRTNRQPAINDDVLYRTPKTNLMSLPQVGFASSHSAPLLDFNRVPRNPKGRVYGSAKVYANTEHRRRNSGFEILPAGTLGARPEFLQQSNKKQSDKKRMTQ